MRFALRALDLVTGHSWEITRSDFRSELVGFVDGLRADRKRLRDPDTGEYPSVIHGIVSLH